MVASMTALREGYVLLCGRSAHDSDRRFRVDRPWVGSSSSPHCGRTLASSTPSDVVRERQWRYRPMWTSCQDLAYCVRKSERHRHPIGEDSYLSHVADRIRVVERSVGLAGSATRFPLRTQPSASSATVAPYRAKSSVGARSKIARRATRRKAPAALLPVGIEQVHFGAPG